MPKIPDAENKEYGDESLFGVQNGRWRKFKLSLFKSMLPGPKGDKGDKGDTGSTGPKGDTGSIGPQGPQGLQGLKGDTGSQGIQGVKGDTGSQGLKGDTGATGPAGSPKRVERFSGTTNASGIATILFSPTPFNSTPDIDVIEGWSGQQMISGAVLTSSATGCTVQVMISKSTLLLSSGPFQAAGSGMTITVRAIGN